MIKIGCDPEFFVIDKETGKYVSAHTLVPGTKQNPSPLRHGGAVQADGLAIEFNIEPASTGKDFVSRVVLALQDIRDIVPNQYAFSYLSAVPFSREYLDGLPEEVRQLGCNPDFNAYTGEPNPAPNADLPMRTGSGHIHIGWTENADINDPEHLEACRMAVTALDLTLGAYMYNLDYGSPRKILYGNAGAFRPKSYGVEYRTPSNRWLNSVSEIQDVFNITLATITGLMDGKAQHSIPSFPQFYSSSNRRTYMFQKLMYSQIPLHIQKDYMEKYNKIVNSSYWTQTVDIPPVYSELVAELARIKSATPIKRDALGRFAPKLAAV